MILHYTMYKLYLEEQWCGGYGCQALNLGIIGSRPCHLVLFVRLFVSFYAFSNSISVIKAGSFLTIVPGELHQY
jgi:hypothetical protein